MILMRTEHGTYRGRSVESAARTVYGKDAVMRGGADPNSPHYGMIVRPARTGGWLVLATIRSVEDAPAGIGGRHP
jgi:hypothetical protein